MSRTKDYHYILFDWDGNLAKTLDLWLEATKIELAKLDVHPTDAEIGASFGAFSKFFADWGVADPEGTITRIDLTVRTMLPTVELYPDTLEMLDALYNRGKHLSLITTSWRATLTIPLKQYHLEHFFEAIVCGDDVTHHKPHPEPLEKALTALGGTKDKALMIGDSDKDIGAANNFGIDSVLFHSPEHQKFYQTDRLHSLNPTYIVDDLRQVLDIVR